MLSCSAVPCSRRLPRGGFLSQLAWRPDSPCLRLVFDQSKLAQPGENIRLSTTADQVEVWRQGK